MRVGAVSPLSRANVIWSRMAQLRMLGSYMVDGIPTLTLAGEHSARFAAWRIFVHVWICDFPRDLFRASSAGVFCRRAYRVAGIGFRILIADFCTADFTGSHRFIQLSRSLPNQSPEPTAVIAVSSACAVHVVVRLWLSFHR